jgi:hypothetical protein
VVLGAVISSGGQREREERERESQEWRGNMNNSIVVHMIQQAKHTMFSTAVASGAR